MKKLLIILAFVGLAAYGVYQRHLSEQVPHLAISGPFEFHGLDLSKDGFIYSRLGVTESLTAISPDGTVQPLLATAWEQSADGLTWRFKIRHDVHFHDGSLLDAEAVRKSLEYAKQKPGVIAHTPIQSIAARGDSLVITLTKPYTPLLTVLAHYTLGIVAPSSFDDEGNIRQLIATGPYQIGQLQPPHRADVVKFSGYWGAPARIDSLSYLAGHRSESRTLLVESGQADVAYSIDPVNRDTLKKSSNVTVNSYTLPRTILLKLNDSHPFFNTKETRRAMSLALDRKGIAQAVLRVPGSEAYQLFSEAQADWHLKDVVRAQNLQLADKLLRQQGWQRNSDGWLVRDGKMFAVTLVTYADRPELPVLATTIQNQLAQVGIKVNVSIDNSSAIPSMHHDNTLEMALLARNFGTLGTPLPLLYNDFSSPKGSDWGQMNWYSAQVHQLLEQLISEKSEQIDREKSQQVARILQDELPVIPIAYSHQMVAVNKRIRGFKFDPFEINYHFAEMSIDE
jgi:peptide/nickel transport system substrate-binding protein